jgi:hypothetical protein
MIDRKALVTRHCPALHAPDIRSPFSVGNGEFAFAADITGLQSFAEEYEHGMPLHTQSQWGWHSFPNPHNYVLEDTLEHYRVGEHEVPYASDKSFDGNSSPAGSWLRANPHRLDLGRLGFVLQRSDGTRARLE